MLDNPFNEDETWGARGQEELPAPRTDSKVEEQRKYANLFAATILAAKKLHEIGVKPSPVRECAIADAVENAKRILEKIDERWPTRTD